jgi:hypothetical protein
LEVLRDLASDLDPDQFQHLSVEAFGLNLQTILADRQRWYLISALVVRFRHAIDADGLIDGSYFDARNDSAQGIDYLSFD